MPSRTQLCSSLCSAILRTWVDTALSPHDWKLSVAVSSIRGVYGDIHPKKKEPLYLCLFFLEKNPSRKVPHGYPCMSHSVGSCVMPKLEWLSGKGVELPWLAWSHQRLPPGAGDEPFSWVHENVNTWTKADNEEWGGHQPPPPDLSCPSDRGSPPSWLHLTDSFPINTRTHLYLFC